MPRICIGDIPIDPFSSVEEAADRLKELLHSSSSEPRVGVTLNPEIGYWALRDEEVKRVVESSSFTTSDGVGITFIVRKKLGLHIPRITGVDVLWEFLKSNTDIPVFLFGARQGVAESVKDKLEGYAGRKMVVGILNGYVSPSEAVDKIVESGAKLVLVALGAGRQERFIARYILPLSLDIFAIGVGGSFDVWAGKVPRAPTWIQRYGLEWMWRNIRQPSRVFRLVGSARFVLWALYRAEVRICEEQGNMRNQDR